MILVNRFKEEARVRHPFTVEKAGAIRVGEMRAIRFAAGIWDTRYMAVSRNTWRWGALVGLSVIAGLSVWLVAIQVFLVLVTPFGTWQRPDIARVTVKWIDRDPQSQFTDNVIVMQGGRERSLSMLKAERADVMIDDEIWILDNYYATATRPAQFRLTPIRLTLEYPEPLLILALLGIWRLRKGLVRDAKEDPDRPRTLLLDDFHSRAQRFAAPQDPESD
jgi:hypothetical protein